MPDEKKKGAMENQGNKKEASDWPNVLAKDKVFKDKCIKILAWVLLTLGLCIIISTFYLAIHQKKSNQYKRSNDYSNNINNLNDKNNDLNIGPQDDKPNIMPPNVSEEDENGDTYDSDGDTSDERSNNRKQIDIDAIRKRLDGRLGYPPGLKFFGCYVELCQIICTHSRDLYTSLHRELQASKCISFNILAINDQEFEKGVLRNHWNDSKHHIQELVIINSNVTRIKSGAFNTAIFQKTFLLSLRKLNLQKMGSGALLGLNSLKYLTIETKIPCLDRSFFQPVQTTLTYLKLNAQYTPLKNVGIFGVSRMEALEYADLSNNNINGPLTKQTLLATPQLKYLIISDSRIAYVETDAFAHLVGKLRLVNLSNNNLVTIGEEVFAPHLQNTKTNFHLTLAMNTWICDCNILPLQRLLKKYGDNIMDPLFCTAPFSLYGTLIDQLKINEDNCSFTGLTTPTTSSTTAPIPPKQTSTTTDDNTKSTVSTTEPETSDISDNLVETTETEFGTTIRPLINESKIFKMRCFNRYDSDESETSAPGLAPDDIPLPSGSGESLSDPQILIDKLVMVHSEIIGLHPTPPSPSPSTAPDLSVVTNALPTFQFEGPDYEFDIELLTNRTVRITFEDFPSDRRIFVIYFTDQDSTKLSPPCAGITNPLLLGPLEENNTYTFCLVDETQQQIPPFNCVPLHVPVRIVDNTWISYDDKQFTIGMLCLIFLLSIFFGAIIAYFGIKAHPDLLEGSKNVLVVKKSDQSCYVSTISESEYIKKTEALERQRSVGASTKKSSLPDTPSTVSMPSFALSVKDLDHLASLRSSSTCFEDAFTPIGCIIGDDNYEMPKQHISYEERCVPNTYVATRPRSPPPLPKRNSCNSDYYMKTK